MASRVQFGRDAGRQALRLPSGRSAGTSAREGSLPATLRRPGDRLPVIAVAAVLAGQLLLPSGWSSAGWVPLSVALVIGLPHGAVDQLVPSWFSVRRLRTGRLLALVLAYAATAAGGLVAFRALPPVGLVLFLGFSIVHFGTGEVVYDRLRGRAGAAPHGVRAALVAMAFGATIVLLPLVRWPAAVAPVLDSLAPGSSTWLPPDGRLGVGVAVLAASAAAGTVAARQGRPRLPAELLLLTVLVLVVPPLPAFAVYFGGWHALRHVLRLLAADPGNADTLAAGRVAPALRRFARQAAGPTAASAAVLALLWSTSSGAIGFLATDLQLLAALTVPHMAVVAWLDRRVVAPVPAAEAAA